MKRLAVRLGLPLITFTLVWMYFAGQVLVVSKPLAAPDVIVSLASHEWERLPEAVDAAARYPSAQVLLTEPDRVTAHNCHDCANRLHRLAVAGVAPSRVRTLKLTTPGTRGEAEACRRAVLGAHFKRLLIVTSPYHTRRTLSVFRRAFSGTDVRIGVAPASRYSPARPRRWWAAPYDRWYVAYEWAALAYYALWHNTWPAFDAGVG